MANTLTGLVPTIYTALDVVSREQIGFIPNVNRDATAQSGAVGQTVRSPIVPAASLEDITAGATPADSGDQTIGYADVTITKSKAYPIRWTGEEQLSVSQFGQYNTILADQFAQGFRTIANAVETDLAAMAKTRASRAYGTAGTTPFTTAGDLSDLAEINRILDDNGAPATGRVMVLNSAARAKLEGKHSELFKVNESGDAGAMLRQRQMRQLQGFTMGYSAGLVQHVKGAASGQLINGAEAAGQTTLTLDTITVNTTGIKAGDIITHASDSANKYVVNTGLAATAGDIVIGNPGLIIGAADNDAVSIGNSYTPNIAFTQNAFVLAARVPAMPQGGDSADDVMLVTDPISGLVFQVAMYRQYRRVKIEIGLAWGVAGVKSEHAATLLG
ncbi:hypothetical protein GGQ86_002984 [Xanthobacter flavus]|uniref:P22 coat-protein 5 family protein n=1 Tax=Xanthobacter flavus TaxID=281 RepID=A0A9W6FN01_XANFL|nr:P22 phage major capsid protein family protein [Xanthobacter flavus]MDR6334502.1 hypothetical protein [Xanthobacter flavus]GLI23478.1 hypothetical protein XFLAVUS301_31520 [Xanthobacter flavus]